MIRDIFLRTCLFCAIGIFSFTGTSSFAADKNIADIFPNAKEKITAAGKDYYFWSSLPYMGYKKIQYLDLYVPKSTPNGTRPAAMITHGGGWSIGDKAASRERNFAEFMVDQGYVAISINYTLVPYEGKKRIGDGWPDNIYDCKSALRWLKKNAKSLHIDPDRIVLIGGSAGGHLSLLNGLSMNNKELNGKGAYLDQNTSIRCIIDFYGPIDAREGREGKPYVKSSPIDKNAWGGSFIKEKFAERPDIWALASPVEHLSSDSPPILIFQGDSDAVVNVNVSRRFNKLLDEKKIPHIYVEVAGAPHSFALNPCGKDLRPIILKFLKENL